MSEISSIATATTLVDVDLHELTKSGTLLEEPVLLLTRFFVRGSFELPCLITTPQGHYAGVIIANGIVQDPEFSRVTHSYYTVLDANDQPLLDVHRCGNLRQSETTICAPSSSVPLARVVMQFEHNWHRYDVYDERETQDYVPKPFSSTEVRAFMENYEFKNSAKEVMVGARNMRRYYSWMQHQLSSPPKPFLLYFEDPSTVSAVQLPIKSRKNDSVLFHEVRGDKVRATPIQHSLPTGDERRLFVLIAQFLIEVEREAVVRLSSDVLLDRQTYSPVVLFK
ncbi:hypothetical protein GLX27_004237 [Malassezia furfur]|uniref:Uncharacterized protein n=1 Tax=Malassezia furfur TaxID=55194 RepID=A0ABY8EXS6_MALFU|nr:hypothetical protein GLX27_004237 [Malassezia furfur]